MGLARLQKKLCFFASLATSLWTGAALAQEDFEILWQIGRTVRVRSVLTGKEMTITRRTDYDPSIGTRDYLKIDGTAMDQGELWFNNTFHEGKLASSRLSVVRGVPDPNQAGAGRALKAVYYYLYGHAPLITSTLQSTNEERIRKVLKKNPYPTLAELQAEVPALTFAGFDYELIFADASIELAIYPTDTPSGTLRNEEKLFRSREYQRYLESNVFRGMERRQASIVDQKQRPDGFDFDSAGLPTQRRETPKPSKGARILLSSELCLRQSLRLGR